MNTDYLDTLPEVKNKYKVNLEMGEKVVFTANLRNFCSDEGLILGVGSSHFTMTNRRIIADSGRGTRLVDIREDVTDMCKVETGSFLSKWIYLQVNLNKEVDFGTGQHKLRGYQFSFSKKDMAKVEEIVSHMR